MIKNLKLYVFDMGNVITRQSKLDKMYSFGEMTCDYRSFRKLFYKSDEADSVYKGLISDDEFFDFIRRSTGSNKSTEELKKLYLESKGGIYDSVVKCISELKNSGSRVFLLSNLKQIDYDYLSKSMDLSVFDDLFLSFKIGMSKPHRDIYKYVIERLGTNRFHFFDDSADNVSAANELGIFAHQTTGEDFPKVLQLLK